MRGVNDHVMYWCPAAQREPAVDVLPLVPLLQLHSSLPPLRQENRAADARQPDPPQHQPLAAALVSRSVTQHQPLAAALVSRSVTQHQPLAAAVIPEVRLSCKFVAAGT